MALIWTMKQDGVNDVMADDVNKLAKAIMESDTNIGQLNIHIENLNQQTSGNSQDIQNIVNEQNQINADVENRLNELEQGGSVDLSDYYTRDEVDEAVEVIADFAEKIQREKLSNLIYYYGDSENPPSDNYEWFKFNNDFSIEMNPETFPNRLKALVIPYSDKSGVPVKSIAHRGFFGCNALEKVIIPRDITKIGDLAFGECTSLAEITFPNTLKEIGGSAFAQCIGLKTVVLPDGLEKIGGQAFSDCDNLETITIPDTVKSIEDYIFLGCGQKVNIIFKGSESQWKSVYPNNQDEFIGSITFLGNLVTEDVIGDIKSALDEIIALQVAKGGDAV